MTGKSFTRRSLDPRLMPGVSLPAMLSFPDSMTGGSTLWTLPFTHISIRGPGWNCPMKILWLFD
jgi:hypothetical protein